MLGMGGGSPSSLDGVRCLFGVRNFYLCGAFYTDLKYYFRDFPGCEKVQWLRLCLLV